ncbi:Ornithine cyclodeaminase, partial [mine drainage metagenome]
MDTLGQPGANYRQSLLPWALGVTGVLLLKEQDVEELLTMDDAIAAIRETFQMQGEEGFGEQPRRRVHGDAVTLSALFAHHPRAQLIGGKVYVSTRERTRFSVLIHDAVSGRA